MQNASSYTLIQDSVSFSLFYIRPTLKFYKICAECFSLNDASHVTFDPARGRLSCVSILLGSCSQYAHWNQLAGANGNSETKK